MRHALRESNSTMQQTIQYNNSVRQIARRRESSLVMAIRIIQNNLIQHGNSNKKSGEAREETGGEGSKRTTGDIKLKNQYNILTDKNLESATSSDTESNEKPNDKFKNLTKRTHDGRQNQKSIENGNADKAKKDDAGADKKTTTVIVGNSMVKYLNANRLRRCVVLSMPTGKHCSERKSKHKCDCIRAVKQKRKS